MGRRVTAEVGVLGPHAGVAAAVVAAGADNLGLVGDAFAVGAAIFFFIRSGTAAGRICAFFGCGSGHIRFLMGASARAIRVGCGSKVEGWRASEKLMGRTRAGELDPTNWNGSAS
jgi:hypothetical protein